MKKFKYIDKKQHREHNNNPSSDQKALVEIEDVILMGRSIGSGPALHLAAYSCFILERKPSALILVSAFKDISKLVADMVGSVAGFIVRNRFKNSGMIEHVDCPTLLIHGKKDTLVPWRHSYTLFAKCRGPCSLMLSERMTHDCFDFVEDLT